MDKEVLRKEMKNKRNNLSLKTREQFNLNIFNNFVNSTYYKISNNIFIFVSYNNEVDTHKIINQAIEDGKNVFVPKVISKEDGMIAVKINSLDDLDTGHYGILEPKNYCLETNPSEIDLAVIPGLAFDLNGGRLGYGGGYYDRFLTLIKDSCIKIALAYDFQVIDCVPMQENDIKIDGIITN